MQINKYFIYIMLIIFVFDGSSNEAKEKTLFIGETNKRENIVLNINNNKIVTFEKEKVHPFDNGFAVIENKKYNSLIDMDGKMILPWLKKDILAIRAMNDYMIVLYSNAHKKYMIVSYDGKVLDEISDKEPYTFYYFTYTSGLREYYYWIYNSEEKRLFVYDEKWKKMMDIRIKYGKFRWLELSRNGMHVLCIEIISGVDRCGYIHDDGKWVILPVFNSASEFVEGRAYVVIIKDNGGKKMKREGYFIDEDGHIVHGPYLAEYMNSYSEGVAFAYVYDERENDVYCFYVDRDGRNIFQKMFGDCGYFSEGYAAVGIEVDKKRINTEKFFRRGKNDAHREYMYGYINRDGRWVIPPEFESAHAFHSGYARARIKGKMGIIDKKGRWVIPPSYRDIIIWDIRESSRLSDKLVQRIIEIYNQIKK